MPVMEVNITKQITRSRWLKSTTGQHRWYGQALGGKEDQRNGPDKKSRGYPANGQYLDLGCPGPQKASRNTVILCLSRLGCRHEKIADVVQHQEGKRIVNDLRSPNDPASLNR